MITVNGVRIEPTVFPDGTSQVWKLPNSFVTDIRTPVIDWTYSNDAEIFSIAQLKLLFDSVRRTPELFINYLPYGRQDKSISNSGTFGLHAFAKLLNTLEFRRVVILDPHSDEYKLINNAEAHYPTDTVEDLHRDLKIDMVVYPDTGALRKYSSLYEFPSISARKKRNESNGDILSTVFDEVDVEKLKGKRVLIVDDICDGGATFIGISKLLQEAESSFIALFVTYGLFTKGTQILHDSGIEEIHVSHGIGKMK